MTRAPLVTTSAVIDALGGAVEVAALTGRRRNAVAQWRRFKTLPANTYLTLSGALRAKGLDAPAWLWGQEPGPWEQAPRRQRRPTAEAV
jgi:hypothetical protein